MKTFREFFGPVSTIPSSRCATPRTRQSDIVRDVKEAYHLVVSHGIALGSDTSMRFTDLKSLEQTASLHIQAGANFPRCVAVNDDL